MVIFCTPPGLIPGNYSGIWAILPAASVGLSFLLCGIVGTAAGAAEKREKHVIGATATISEVSTGIPFEARIDTGAQSCSLHVEKLEIENPEKGPNRGKPIRFLIKNGKGESGWIETKIAVVVRVKSSSLKGGRYDRRYKVRLNLKWKDLEKEVLVTLDNRTGMDYPMLIGRNFLHGDFLVDVAIENPDKEMASDSR